LDTEGEQTLRWLQHLADTIPQNDPAFSSLLPSPKGTSVHLELESAIKLGWYVKDFTGANFQRVVAEMWVDANGIIKGIGNPPGGAQEGWRTIDVALLKEGTYASSIKIGTTKASDVLEIAMDYKTGNAQLSRVAHMEQLIKTAYIKLVQGGDVVLTAEQKMARFSAFARGISPALPALLSVGVALVPGSRDAYVRTNLLRNEANPTNADIDFMKTQGWNWNSATNAWESTDTMSWIYNYSRNWIYGIGDLMDPSSAIYNPAPVSALEPDQPYI
jgi:hypothetical protein